VCTPMRDRATEEAIDASACAVELGDLPAISDRILPREMKLLAKQPSVVANKHVRFAAFFDSPPEFGVDDHAIEHFNPSDAIGDRARGTNDVSELCLFEERGELGLLGLDECRCASKMSACDVI
jgi:hypothetical protein